MQQSSILSKLALSSNNHVHDQAGLTGPLMEKEHMLLNAEQKSDQEQHSAKRYAVSVKGFGDTGERRGYLSAHGWDRVNGTLVKADS